MGQESHPKKYKLKLDRSDVPGRRDSLAESMIASVKTQRLVHLKYGDVVRAKMAENHDHVAYDRVCKDPICHTVVKAMFEGCQGQGGWTLMWALDIMARDVPFEDLRSDMCGNCMEAIRSCICDWETDDETDYANAMVVYASLLDVDEEMPPPRLKIF